MGTIANITCTFGLPENDEREQKMSLGQATDGSWKKVKFRESRRILDIPIRGLSTADKTILENALENRQNQMVKLVPDSHIDFGGGAGNEIYGQWLDDILDFQKVKNYWEGLLTFAFGFAFRYEDIVYFKNDVEITGTYESPQTLTTNAGALVVRENGDPFPEIDLTAYKATVIVQASNGTETTFGVDNIQQASTNISFDVYASGLGRGSAADNKFYANVSISLEAITP